jgi:hypothetical protein
MVKLGTHEKPRTEATSKKRGDIKISLWFWYKRKTEEAKKAVSDARLANPEDTSLILTEANLYLETKDFDTYKKLVAQGKKSKWCRFSFNLEYWVQMQKHSRCWKILQESNRNQSTIHQCLHKSSCNEVREWKVIIDEMNKLGTLQMIWSATMNWKEKRKSFQSYNLSLKSRWVRPNVDVNKTLLGVYSALEMTAEYKALKEAVNI